MAGEKRKHEADDEKYDSDEDMPQPKKKEPEEKDWYPEKNIQRLFSNVNAFVSKDSVDMDLLYEKDQVDLIVFNNTYSDAQKKAINFKFEELAQAIKSARRVPRHKLSVHIPAPHHTDYKNIIKTCTFKRPTEVTLKGSYAYHAAPNADCNIDISVLIPKECIEYEDRYNQVWLIKKACYTAIVAHHLAQLPDKNYVLKYVRPRDSPLDIALDVTVSDGTLCFRVNFGLHEESIPLGKIYAWTCCVKPEHVDMSTPGTEKDWSATPVYTHTLFASQHITHPPTELLLKSIIRDNKNAQEATCLIRHWAQQRNIGKGSGFISNFHLKMLLIFLIKSKVIAEQALPMRMFRLFIEYLVKADWSEPRWIGDVKPKQIDRHQEISEVVLIAPGGKINYLCGVTRHNAELVTAFAKLTVPLLHDRMHGEQFRLLFLVKIPPYQYYDELITINQISKIPKSNLDSKIYTDTCGDTASAVIPNLLSVLNKALDDRATLIDVIPTERSTLDPVKSSEMDEAAKQLNSFNYVADDTLVLGLKLTANTTDDPVRRGPQAQEEEKSREFQKFWGEKSKLRRFLDGTICEAVVWNTKKQFEKRRLLATISKFVLQRHLQIEPGNVSFARHVLDRALRADPWSIVRHTAVGREEQVSVQDAFHSLTNKLKGLDIPRQINSTELVCPVQRFTQVFAPFKFEGKDTKNYPPYKVLCVLEGGKWPRDDPSALHILKSIFMLTMAESFGKQIHISDRFSTNSKSKFKDDNREAEVKRKALPSADSLIVAEGPYLFELALSNQTEANTLRFETKKTPQQIELCKEIVLEPLYNQQILGVSTAFPCYPEVARLLKRWAGTHMFSSLVPDMVLDLIACYPLLNPAPYDAPCSTFNAFVNVINLLATFDFSTKPLILRFNEGMKDKTVNHMIRDVAYNRSMYPCLVILSEIDDTSMISRTVAPFTLKLIRETAQRSRVKLAEIFHQYHAFTWKALKDNVFCSPDPTRFNMLIELLPVSERTVIHNLNGAYHISIDSAELFVKHLEKAYGDLAIILYDRACIHRIGLIWKPGALSPAPLETCHNMNARTVVSTPDDSEEGMVWVKPDIACIQDDITHCGQGIIQQIWVNN